MMGIFEKCQIVFDLDAVKVSYKVRQGLKTKISHHSGVVAYSLNKKTTHLIADDGKRGGFSHKCIKAQKLNIPIVGISYVDDCIAASRLLNPTPYLIIDTYAQSGFGHGKIVGIHQRKDKGLVIRKKVFHQDLHSVKIYSWNSPNAPEYPSEGDYVVARSLLLDSIKEEKSGKHTFYQLELHAAKKKISQRIDEEPDNAFMYRVFTHYGDVADLKDEDSGVRECRYLRTSQAAVDVYRQLYEQRIKPPWKMKRCKKTISRWIGSPTFRKDSFEARCLDDGKLASDVVSLVEQIWLEAVGHLTDILACPMNKVGHEQVEKGESLLLQIREGLDKKTSQAELSRLSKEYYSQIPHKKELGLKNKQDITREQGICQLLSDVQSVSEATDWSIRGSTEAKYRTLRCHIEQLSSDSAEYLHVVGQIQEGLTGNEVLKVKKIFAVDRFVENSNFTYHLGNKNLLFHSSKPSNFLGILSRGLLMPKIVVEDLGGKRTDAGMLGHGIYFADNAGTSASYAAPSALSHTRFMMICEVSLGRCHEVNHYQPELNQPPNGYDSVKGVGAIPGQIASDFKANEYTIYNVNQQRLRYLVEFSMPEDQCDHPSSFIPEPSTVPMETEDTDESKEQLPPPPVEMKDVMAVPNPNDKVVSGLQTTANKPIPLKNVSVRGKMMDLAAQVVIFQEYDNVNRESIEAKYVFPLEDCAAVCGFEAFIGDKHIVGTVKEKAQAHKEYKEAISKGHGAYLMDEEAPDVFTVSVGNLPPKVKVVIKITYVIELSVEGDKIAFNLPGSVAPWRKEAAMSQVLQKDVTTLKIKDQSSIAFSLAMSIEMAADITSVESTTHPLKIKQTATKAVITLPEDCTTLKEGFQLLVGVADIHRPRMWVEQHPENKDSQACMVTFYPDFESSTVEKAEIILLLDCSNSMKEGPLKQAKQILLLTLHHMPDDCIFNVVTFGTGFEELFANSQAKTESTIQAATSFINQACATQGNTDAWRPLQSYFLLRSEGLQNLFLVSDGHINNEQSTLHAIAQNTHSRIFTFGVSSSANRHLLKGMARVGCGAFEFFDNNAKSKWENKVKAQLSKAKQPSVSSLEVEWKQYDNNPPTPVQAPRQLTSLFNGSRLVVYGFVQYCTEACLKASIDGEEVSTMVSTPELCITKGQMLHRLTARAVIRDWEDGTLDPDKTHHEARKNEQKSYVIDLSKKYSIVTQLTSFVAIEKREEGEDLQQRSVSLMKLAEAEDVDFLSYMDWQKTMRLDSEQDVDPIQKVQDLLTQANLESTFSVLKAEDCYHQALDLAASHLPDSTEVYIKTASALHKFLINSKRDVDKANKLRDKMLQKHLDRERLSTDAKLKELILAMTPEDKVMESHILPIGPRRDIHLPRCTMSLRRQLAPTGFSGMGLLNLGRARPPRKIGFAAPLAASLPAEFPAAPLPAKVGKAAAAAAPPKVRFADSPASLLQMGHAATVTPLAAPPPPVELAAAAPPHPVGLAAAPPPHPVGLAAAAAPPPPPPGYAGLPPPSIPSGRGYAPIPPPPLPPVDTPPRRSLYQTRVSGFSAIGSSGKPTPSSSEVGASQPVMEHLQTKRSVSPAKFGPAVRSAFPEGARGGRSVLKAASSMLSKSDQRGEEEVRKKLHGLTSLSRMSDARISDDQIAFQSNKPMKKMAADRVPRTHSEECYGLVSFSEKEKKQKKKISGQEPAFKLSELVRCPSMTKRSSSSFFEDEDLCQEEKDDEEEEDEMEEIAVIEDKLEITHQRHHSFMSLDECGVENIYSELGLALSLAGDEYGTDLYSDPHNSMLERKLGSRSSSRSKSRSRSRSRSHSRSRSRSSSRSLLRPLSPEVTVEGLTSRVYTRKHELKMWQRALCKGNIPDSFPGWTMRELSRLKQAVNDFMMTLEPFQVPVIVQSLPDKTTLESLVVMDLFSCEDEYDMSSNDEEDTSSDEEYEPEANAFFTLGKHVNFVKLFGFLKNAGIYSLGRKTVAKLLRVLMVALLVCAVKRHSSTQSTEHLNLNQLTHYIRDLEIARTDSWLNVASQMISHETVIL